VAETAFDEMVMGAGWLLCDFSVLGSPRNHPDLSQTVQDEGLEPFGLKKGAVWEQKMLKSTKAKVDKQFARACHQLREQKIDESCTAM